MREKWPATFQHLSPIWLAPFLSIWWLQFRLKGKFSTIISKCVYKKKFDSEFFYLFRYFAVKNSNSLMKTKVLILISFILSLIWPSAPLFGWSYYSLEGGLTSCSVEWSDKTPSVVSYNITILITVFFIPIIIIATTNILLVIKVI